MLSAHLLDAISCCLPVDDRARVDLVPVPEPVAVAVTPIVKFAPVKARVPSRATRPRAALWLCAPVMDVLRQGGAMTPRDVAARLNATGVAVHADKVSKALRTLELDGQVKATALTSRRDIERCGGQWLWQVAR